MYLLTYNGICPINFEDVQKMKNSLSHKEILKFIEDQPIRISIFGEFSSGKTTLINGLIGEAILSVAVDPTTAVPTYIRYAKEFNVLVHLINGEKLRLFEDEPPFWTRFVGRQSVLNTLKKQEGEIKGFLKEWTKEGKKSNEVQNIAIELPLPWLKKNIELVDTPGTNAGIDSHEQHTKHVSEDTDIAIFLLDARQGGGKKTEFNYINKVQQAVSQSFIVVNKMDLLDEEEGEREDILDYIKNETIPKHWVGTIQPKVFGVSSLVRLDGKIAEAEPGLLKEFYNLISVVEETATKKRGKILLDRVGNPERSLFEQAKKYESEKKFDKAHRVYFDLLDILQAAEMDISSAQNGIERCENILNSQVSELDEINRKLDSVLLLEEKDPDECIKQLKKIQQCLTAMNAPDEDVNKTIVRLAKRIKIRNAARGEIGKWEKAAKVSAENQDYIFAVEQINKFHELTDKAELPEEECKRLNDYENSLIELRNADALNRWKEWQKEIGTYFEDNSYNKAEKLIPNIEKYSPCLPKEVQKDCKRLVLSIKSKNEQWEQYKRLFQKLKNKFLELFKENAVNSSLVNDVQEDLKQLDKYAERFIKDYRRQPTLQVKNDVILSIEKRLQFVDFLMTAGSVFNLKNLEELKWKLLQRKEELTAIPDDAKIWFNNPNYFKKYPDHSTALSLLTDLEISNKFKFKKAYQLILNINAIKPHLNDELNKIVHNKEIELLNILIKKRFGVFKTKKEIANDLLAEKCYDLSRIVSEQIHNDRSRFKMLLTLAEKQAKSGDITGANTTFEAAIATAKQLEDASDRSEALVIIAEKQAVDPTIKKEITAAKQLKDTYGRSKALAIIAEKQAKSGDITGANTTFEAAIATAKQFEDAYSRSKALAIIAEKQAESKMFEAAIATAKQLEDASDRSEALVIIAEKQANAQKKGN